MTQQIIDSTNGGLIFSNDFTVSSKTIAEEIIVFFGLENKQPDEKTGWCSYNVRHVKLGDTHLRTTFYFNNGSLKMTDFIIADKEFIECSWDDWNEKEELEQEKKYDKWISDQIGDCRQFDWGLIHSFYDRRSAGTSIIITYQ